MITYEKLIKKHTKKVDAIDYKSLGSEVKKIRLANDLTLRETSKMLKISSTYLWEMEQGVKPFKLSVVENFIKKLSKKK